MNFAEIESAVDARHSVHWSHEGYRVHRDPPGQYLITYLLNGSTIGLTDRSGQHLNGAEAAFFVLGSTRVETAHSLTSDGTSREVREKGKASFLDL